MPFYHATWDRHIASIETHGLGGAQPDFRNFDCQQGVYLCRDPIIAVGFLIEAMMLNARGTDSPAKLLETVRILVIDDGRINEKLIKIDPEIERRDLTITYDGVIDIRGMPILRVGDLEPPEPGS